MKVLVACEFSGIVREAFTRKGHLAVSCDLLPTEQPGIHYQGDVRAILDRDWDLIIAHPSCQYLCNSGSRWLWHPDDSKLPFEKRRRHPKHPNRFKEMQNAKAFFDLFLNHPCDKICIENPIPHRYTGLPRYSQLVQPHHFGETESKATCLWNKGLPPLVRTHWMDKSEIKQSVHKASPGPDRWKIRSKTFQSIANVMAGTWG